MLLSFVAADKANAIEGGIIPAALPRLHSSLEATEGAVAWASRPAEPVAPVAIIVAAHVTAGVTPRVESVHGGLVPSTLTPLGAELESAHEVSIPAGVPGEPEVAPGSVGGGDFLEPLAGPAATGQVQPVQGGVVAPALLPLNGCNGRMYKCVPVTPVYFTPWSPVGVCLRLDGGDVISPSFQISGGHIGPAAVLGTSVFGLPVSVAAC